MKHTMKKLLAALLACLLLLSSVALADQTSTVTVSQGEQIIDENVTVSSQNASGVNATGGEVTVNGNVTASGKQGKGVKASGGEVTVNGDVQATGEGGVAVQSSGDSTVNVTGDANGYHFGVDASGGSTVTVGKDAIGGAAAVQAIGEETKVTVEGNAHSDESTGAYAANGSTIEVKGNVSGGMGAIAVGSTVKVGGDVTGGYTGVDAYGEGTEVNVTGNVTATTGTGVNAAGGAQVTVGTEEKPATVTSANGRGVKAAGEGTQVTVTGNVSSDGTGVEAKDGGKVEVGGSVTGGDGYEKHGIDASGAGTEVKVGGNVSSESYQGSGVNATDGAQVEVVGGVSTIQGDNAVNASGAGTKVTVGGNVTNTFYGGTAINADNGSTVTVGTEEKPATVTGNSGVHARDGGTVTVKGDVTGEEGFGVSTSNSTSTVTVDGNVKSSSSGIIVDGGAVKVTGDVEGTNGIATRASTSIITVDGSVTGKDGCGIDMSAGGEINVGKDVTGKTVGVQANGGVINVGGDVTSTGGIGVITEGNAQVTVQGDVKGEGGVGMELTGNMIFDDLNQEIKPQTVIVDGTVSGKDGAIVVKKSETIDSCEIYNGNKFNEYTTTYNYDTDNIDLTMWKAEGEDAIRMVDTTVVRVINEDNYGQEDYYTENTTCTTNVAATEAFLQTVNYIIRLFDGEGISSAMVSEAQSVAVGQENYYTAHEGEKVKLGVALDEGEVLQGVYYDGADESTLTEVADLEKDESGSFFIAMKRYGGMLLKLKTHKHSPATVKENVVPATCTQTGSYEEVKKCSVCGVEMSREKKTVDKLGHTGGSAVKENIVAAKPGVKGHYDEVVYCSACKEELSRKTVEIDALPVEEETKTEEKAEETKTEEKTEEKAEETKPAEESEPAEEAEESAANAPRTEFVYVPVDANTEVNGVKAADRPGMAEAFKKVGDSLDGEGASIDIVDKEKLMDAEELKRFDRLSVKDRLLVALKALGFGEALGDIADDMSDDAVALSDDIAARVDALTDAEKQALLDRLYGSFLPRLIIIDGQEYEAVGIEVVITRGGEKSYERYTFYKDEGAWKLYQIEKGEYRTVAA